MARCICDWPPTCHGGGTLRCRGCGGDACICQCGGEEECYGCRDCDREDDYEDDEEHAWTCPRHGRQHSPHCFDCHAEIEHAHKAKVTP